jgi:hypothetical protein
MQADFQYWSGREGRSPRKKKKEKNIAYEERETQFKMSIIIYQEMQNEKDGA